MASGFILIAGLSGMSIMDLMSNRIPNSFVVGFLIISFILALFSGYAGLLAFFSGLIVGTVIFIIPYYFGVIGGADVKVFGVTGSFLGMHQTIDAFLYTLIAGLGIALLYKLVSLITALQYKKSIDSKHKDNDATLQVDLVKTGLHIAYIPAILIGVILSFKFPLEYS